MNTTKILIVAFISTVSCLSALAQSPSDELDRSTKWRNEVRNYKHEFFSRELDLTKEQQQEFFDAYDEMEDRIAKLNNEARDLERRTLSDPDATDTQFEDTARAFFELKGAESEIELEYFDKFKSILTPRQLIRIKNTERKFTQQLVQQHRRLNGPDARRKRQ